MCFPCVSEFSAFCKRTLSRFKCSLNAFELDSRIFPWIGFVESMGGCRTNFFNEATRVESRIFWIGLDAVLAEAIAAGICARLPENRKGSRLGEIYRIDRVVEGREV